MSITLGNLKGYSGSAKSYFGNVKGYFRNVECYFRNVKYYFENVKCYLGTEAEIGQPEAALPKSGTAFRKPLQSLVLELNH